MSHSVYRVHTVSLSFWHGWARNVVAGSHTEHGEHRSSSANKGGPHTLLIHMLTLHTTQAQSSRVHGRHTRSLKRLGRTISSSCRSSLHSYQSLHSRFVVHVASAVMNCPVAAHVVRGAHRRFEVRVGGADSYSKLTSQEKIAPQARKLVGVGGAVWNSPVASHVTLPGRHDGVSVSTYMHV